jgi:16S rRNA (cytosine1402-N4)-methyltransferase
MVTGHATMTYDTHQSVLMTEVMDGLNLKADGIYIDATFGRGGHAQVILNSLGPTGRLLALDKDPDAITYACLHFSKDPRFSIKQGSFTQLISLVTELNLLGKIDGILFDLGVSSPQLDNPDRGFSFLRAGKLDMRMDNTQDIDAATWIARTDEKTIADVLWQYGEERHSRRIAAAIVKAREVNPIETTDQLAAIIAAAHPAWQKGKNPATQSFQAIRIAINHELDDLQQALQQSMTALSIGGRLVVISFHSLEDRIVKQFMLNESRHDDLPSDFPIKHDSSSLRFKRVSKAIKASATETESNPRARSATLRIGEKLL